MPQNMQITMCWWLASILMVCACAHTGSARMGVCTIGELPRTSKCRVLSTISTQTLLKLCYIDFGQLGTGWASSLSSTSAASSRPMSFSVRYSLYTVESRFVPQRSRSCWVALVGHSARLLITFQGKSNMLATFRQLLGGLVGFKKFASSSMISWETSRNIIPFSCILPGFRSGTSW